MAEGGAGKEEGREHLALVVGVVLAGEGQVDPDTERFEICEVLQSRERW